MAEEPPRGSYAIKYVCMYVCMYVIYRLVKNKGVKLPFETENKNIPLHLHARSKQLLLPLIL